MFDFDQIIDRRRTNSLKWDGLNTHFGNSALLPLWVADMDFETAPEIVTALHERVEHKIFGYVETPISLYQLASDWTKKRYGYAPSPDQIAFSPGVVPSLSVLIDGFSHLDDKILIQPPVYGPFSNMIKSNSRTVVTSPLVNHHGMYTIDFEDFEKKASDPMVKWFILCHPHNPVGRVWTMEELKKLGEICLKHQVRVISDEIWRDLTFEGHPHIPFASLSKEIEDVTITLFSVTKTFNLAGIQASFAHFPRTDELEKFKSAFGRLDISRHSPFNLTAMEAAFTKGEPWLCDLKDYLEANMIFLESYLKEHLPHIIFKKPEATYLAWLDLRFLNLPQNELMALLQEKGLLAVNDGLFFGAEGEGFIRLNVACPKSILEEALTRLSKLFD